MILKESIRVVKVLKDIKDFNDFLILLQKNRLRNYCGADMMCMSAGLGLVLVEVYALE